VEREALAERYIMPIVFTSRVFDVEIDQRRQPDGRAREVVIVRHRPSVVLIPVDDDGRLILVRQYRAPLDRYTWEFPAGGVELGEFVEAAAARECEEEIGLVPGRLEHLGSWYPVPGYCDEQMIFFRLSQLRPPAPDSPHKPDEDEDIETRTMSVDDARAMVRRGEVIDLKTAYALTLL
jgi:ADP-ribose pyrophosphatase